MTAKRHIDVETMKMLYRGRLRYSETAACNIHLMACDECRGELRRLVDSGNLLEAPAEAMMEKCREIFFRDRAAASRELDYSPPLSVELPPTQLDMLLRDLGEMDPGRFLLTKGKLKSSIQTIKESISRLDESSSLTPEGEKSFVTFLARCVEQNTADFLGEDEEADLEALGELLDALKGQAAAVNTSLGDPVALREPAEAFQDKLDNLLTLLERRASGQ